MRIKRFVLLLFLVAGLALPGALAMAQPALAAPYNPIEGACKDEAKNSPTCQSGNSTPITGSNGIIMKVTRIVAVIAGAVAVIAIITYGIMIVVSYGDSAKVVQARNGIIAAVVGLAIVALAQAIVAFVVKNI